MSRVAFLGSLLSFCVVAANSARAQSLDGEVSPRTRAERTDYRETSSFADVVSFVGMVSEASPIMSLTHLGYTMEGRALPVVVVSDLDTATPAALKASGKVRLFIQANIHGGEVCGKEAMQVLLRRLANGEHREWLDSLVLLIAPIYNADGNERVRLTNRPYQHGPLGGMGQRANAQGLDLNRDNMKLESPEARSLLSFWNRYDPDVIMDLHTTNGTRHAYHVTYAPPLHPNTDSAIVRLLRDRLLPEVTRSIRTNYGRDFYYYGNLPWPGSDAERGWYTFSHLPRFLTNYVGLRNRLGILSEAYAYATFEERIETTLHFVEEVADYVYRHASEVRLAVREADRRELVGQELALRAEYQHSEQPVEILLGEVKEERNPYSGEPILKRMEVRRPERMPEFGAFAGVEFEAVPTAYLIPGELAGVLELLSVHGIEWARLEEPRTASVERFAIDSTRMAEREYQGHRQRTVFGRYERVELTVPGGAAIVSLEQPLGRLAFLLLEPRSDDGVLNWNLLDEALEGSRYYPILRLRE